MNRQLYAGGGIESLTVPREQYGLGSFVKKTIRKVIPNEVSKIGQVAGPVLSFFNPALGASVTALSNFDQTGSIGDSLKKGALTYGATQIARGITGAGMQPLPGQDGFSMTSFDNPLSFGNKTADGIDLDALYGDLDPNAKTKKNFLQKLLGKGKEGITSLTNIFNKTGTVSKDETQPNDYSKPRGIADLALAGLSIYGAKKSYDDQKRINEAQQRDYDEFKKRQEEKRKQYNTGNLDVRYAAAGGGFIRGLKNFLDEAFENVSSRSDFDINDYKLRGQLMAEELAELRFKKDLYDLDQRTQLDLYEAASDYLDDEVADYGDMMYDSFRDGKMDGGIMDLNVRTNPQGTKEIDYREEGGFVPPIGIKEKADDIPAMLSNNEFVFTADAVRGAGDGDVNKGAQKMYALMSELEEEGKA